MTNGKVLATGDLKTGEITRTETGIQLGEDAATMSASAKAPVVPSDTSDLKKKLREFGFVEQEFPADGSFSISNPNLVN